MVDGIDLSALIGKIKEKQIEPVYVRLGQEVRAMREAAGIEQAALATQAGVPVSTLAGLEGGKVRVMLHDVEALAKALGVSGKVLMGRIWT